MDSTQDIAHWSLLHNLDRGFLAKVEHFFLYNSCNSMLLLTTDGKVYGYGCNQRGVLGVGSAQCYFEVPTEVVALRGKKLSSVVAGRHHVMALCEDHSLYGWGFNQRGQVGNGSTKLVCSPVLILENVKSVSCGSEHTVAIGINGNVWAWGFNVFGQVGESNARSMQPPVLQPTELVIMQRLGVTNAKCGCFFTAYFNGIRPYIFGFFVSESEPSINSLPSDTKVVGFGAYFSYLLLLTEQGELYRFSVTDQTKGYDLMKTPESIQSMVIELDYHLAILVAHSGTFYAMLLPPDHHYRIIRVSLTSLADIWWLYGNFTTSMPGLSKLPSDVIASGKIESLNFFNDRSSSDFVLNIVGKPIFLHRKMIQNVPLFQPFFVKRPELRVLEFGPNEFSYVIYYTYFRYLYTKCLEIESAWFFEFLSFISSFNDQDLMSQCLEKLNRVSLEDVCRTIGDYVEKSHLERHIREDPQTPESCSKFFEAAAQCNDSLLKSKIVRAVVKQTEWGVEQCTKDMQLDLVSDFTDRVTKISEILSKLPPGSK